MTVKQRPSWEEDTGTKTTANSLGWAAHFGSPHNHVLSEGEGLALVQKNYPDGVTKEGGRGAAELAGDDLLAMVWFREAERAGPRRKALVAGGQISVQTVKQRVF